MSLKFRTNFDHVHYARSKLDYVVGGAADYWGSPAWLVVFVPIELRCAEDPLQSDCVAWPLISLNALTGTMQVATKQQCRGNVVLLKLPIHTYFGRFWEHDEMTALFALNSKGTSLWGNKSFEPLKQENRSSGSTRVYRIEKKNMVVKSHNISHIGYGGNAPVYWLKSKFLWWVISPT